MINKLLIRNLEYEDLIETFLVFSVTSILGIRVYLMLTGYPQIGSGGIHVAHVLWGGFFMVAAIFLLLAFVNVEVKRLAAVVGGIGFGTFIDELGKFLTSDNNYFFEPTFALIYIVFIALYLLQRILGKYKKISKDEYLINSLEYLKEAVIHDLDRLEKRKALMYLRKSDQTSEVAIFLKKVYEDVHTLKTPRHHIFLQVRKFFSDLYLKATEMSWFGYGIVFIFLAEAFLTLFTQFSLIFGRFFFLPSNFIFIDPSDVQVPQLLSIVADSIAALFIILGAIRIKTSRIGAFLYFKRGILVSIFIGQVFAFYTDQLFAFFGLIFNIILLNAVNYMIERERTRKEDE